MIVALATLLLAAAPLESAWRAHGAPGYVVAVADVNGLIHVEAAGVRRRGAPARIRASDAFHIASIAKPITSTMLATLVEEGKLRWSSTPAEVWPEWRAEMNGAAAGITLEQILRHRAGIARLEEDADIAKLPRFDDRQQFARWLVSRPLDGQPGTFAYSNGGYGLAAAMAEKVTGETWEALIRERVFAPLRMASCGFGLPPAVAGHVQRNGRWTPFDDGLPRALAPSGDVHCNAFDLAAFGRAHLAGLTTGHPLLRPETWKALHRAEVDEYALGWNVQKFGETHRGSLNTFSAGLVVSPQRGIVIVSMLNGSGENGAFLSAVVKWALGQVPAPARAN